MLKDPLLVVFIVKVLSLWCDLTGFHQGHIDQADLIKNT